MNVFKELNDVENMQDDLKNMQDIILDNYKKNPKKCERFLKELCNIDKELKELEMEFEKLQNEIY